MHLLDGLFGLAELFVDLLDRVDLLGAVAIQHSQVVGVELLDQLEQLAGLVQDVVGDLVLDASCDL